MKVLIVSHNCLSSTSNMGKTLLSYFRDFSPEELAQLFIHCEEPTEGALCRNYYRFTDLDALKRVLGLRASGRRFGPGDIRTDRVTARVDRGWLRSLYCYGERRTAAVFALRNLLWRLCRWDTRQFWQWVEEFSPDVIFFAAGDYGFAYDIAQKIARRLDKPLAVCCVDDFYLYNRNGGSILGRALHRSFLKTVKKTMARAGRIFVICESMKRAYEPLFGKPCRLLYTPALMEAEDRGTGNGRVAYLGNLGLKRHEQVIAIGRALSRLKIPGIEPYLHVYSGERREEIRRQLTPENGICFHGAVSAGEVLQVMQSSAAVIHTESFDPHIRKIVGYSVSTKIPESLMNGPCLIAYGPEGIASMEYLRENGAAYCITEPEELEQGLREILTDPGLREQIRKQGRELAQQNHRIGTVSAGLRQELQQLCREQKRL